MSEPVRTIGDCHANLHGQMPNKPKDMVRVRELLSNEGFDDQNTNAILLHSYISSAPDQERTFAFLHQRIVDHRRQCEDEFPSIIGDDVGSAAPYRKSLRSAPTIHNQRETENGEWDAKRPRFADAAEYILLCTIGMRVFDMKLFVRLKQRVGDFIVDPCARIREGARVILEGTEEAYRCHILGEEKSHSACLRAADMHFRAAGQARRSLERREEWARCVLHNEESLALSTIDEGNVGALNSIRNRQILRWNMIERAVQSTLPYPNFLACIQKRRKFACSLQPIVVQAIARVFPDSECPLTSILMYKLNALAHYLMHTSEGRQFRFGFRGRHSFCKEGPYRFMCADALPYQMLLDLVHDADGNPTTSTWPINREGLMKIKAVSHRTLWEKWAANQGGSAKSSL
jgi:hypothetical protein